MLEIFRKNIFINSLAILLYIIVLRIATFIQFQPIEIQGNGILTALIQNGFRRIPLLLHILQIPLLFIQAVYINRLFNIHRLNQPPHLFPGLFYALVMSFGLQFSQFNGILLANTFLIIAWFQLFVQSRNDRLDLHTFNLGLSIGMASLFYLPIAFTLGAAVIGLIVLRTVRTADYYRLLIGAAVPYYLMGTTLFVTDNWSLWKSFHFTNNWIFFWQHGLPISAMILIFLLAICVLIVAAQSGRLGKGYNVHVRRKVQALWWWLGLSALVALIGPVEVEQHWQMLALPISVLLGMSMYNLENKTAAEILHIVLFGSTLALQFLI